MLWTFGLGDGQRERLAKPDVAFVGRSGVLDDDYILAASAAGEVGHYDVAWQIYQRGREAAKTP